ncbi:MAG: M20/M25/M40 family metallo-hydrolase [Gemmatimonadetes bacterium]|nr:M20/M25/M40 family metallo-hydrolase [Gemmatimonadota bacterium]
MSDFDLPDLPSDEELGITDDDREKYGDELPDDGPEMSADEMETLLGASSPAGGAAEPDAKAHRKAKRAAQKEAKKKARAARKQAKQAERRAKEEAKAARSKVANTTESPGAEGQAESDAKEKGSGSAGTPGGPPALAAMAAWRGPVTLLLLLGLSIFASTRTGQVSPEPSNADPSQFSSARAMGLVEDIAREAHPPGSPEHARVRELLLERLRQLGLEPEVQTTTSMLEFPASAGGGDGVAQVATVRNIVARIPGSNPTGAVLITAHYDSRGIAPGAGDDASGVAAIVEALRALQTGPALRNDIIVLFSDAEELGLLGARAFVDEHPWMAEVDLVLSFEMRGGGGPSIMFETNERNGWVVRGLESFDPHPFANSMSYEVYERLPRDTDFTPFKEAGVQGLNFAAIDNAHVYHQVYDAPENLSESTLQHHGVRALEGLRYFANTDLTSVNDANVVFFSVPVLGLVVYDQIWVVAISLLNLLLFAVLFAAARRTGGRTSRVAASAVLSLGLLATGYFIANGAFAWLAGQHPEYGALQGSAFHSEGWYVIGLVFLSMLLVVAASVLTRRWIAPVELQVGAMILPLLASVAAGFAAPLAAMNLQWPVAAGLLAAVVMAVLASRGSGTVGWIVYVLLAVPVFVMLLPVVELLWLAMSLEVAGILVALSTLGLFLSLPLLHSLEAPNRWWAPAALGLAAAASFGMGLLGSGPTADHPAPSTLVYAYEHGAAAALWATAPRDAASPEAWEWAVERSNGEPEVNGTLEAYGLPGIEFATTPARVLLAEPPFVQVVTDTVLGDARRVVVHLRSRIGAESIGVDLGGDTRVVNINGQPVSNVEGLRWIAHWGVPDSALVVELTTPQDGAFAFHVVEHLLRPEELLGRDAFRRPPELAPNINRASDRAMFRYAFGDGVEVEERPADGAASAADTAASPSDTAASPPDTAATPPDTAAAPPDTGSAVQDSAATPRDTVAAPPDTTTAPSRG